MHRADSDATSYTCTCVCSFLSRPTESRYRTIPSPQAPSCYSSQLYLLHCPFPNPGGHSSVLYLQNFISGVTWVEPYSSWNFLRLSSFTQYNVPEVNPSSCISFYLLSNIPCYGWTIVWLTIYPWRTLGSFQLWAIMKKSYSEHLCIGFCVDRSFYFSTVNAQECCMLGHLINPFVISKETCKIFSKVAESFTIPPIMYEWSNFLHRFCNFLQHLLLSYFIYIVILIGMFSLCLNFFEM